MKEELLNLYKEYRQAVRIHIISSDAHEDEFHKLDFESFIEWLEYGFTRCKYYV